MEKFLLKQWHVRVETWQIALAGLVTLFALIGFGSLVMHADRNYEDAGPVSKLALKMAVLPAESQAVINELVSSESPDLARDQRFAGQTGFELHQNQPETEDLILLSRYDGDRMRSVVEVVDPNSGDVLHEYLPDVDVLREAALEAEAAVETPDPGVDIAEIYRPDEYGIFHPWIDQDGSLVIKDYQSPVARIDVCSNHEWTTYGRFHHALESDDNDTFWTSSRVYPAVLPDVDDTFESDSIVQMSAGGEVLFEQAISQILIDNDLLHYVYMGYDHVIDPFHLNDVEPVLEDGPHWQRGDVFLSLRNRSMVILYRPSTHEVVWYQIGPWLTQHDVDVVSDTEISIFSNNTGSSAQGEFVVDGYSEVMVHDLATGKTSSPWEDGFKAHQISTFHQGLSRRLDDGRLFVEEQVPGRLLMLDSDGEMIWSYINGASDEQTYNLKWSRYIEGEKARQLRQLIDNGIDC